MLLINTKSVFFGIYYVNYFPLCSSCTVINKNWIIQVSKIHFLFFYRAVNFDRKNKTGVIIWYKYFRKKDTTPIIHFPISFKANPQFDTIFLGMPFYPNYSPKIRYCKILKFNCPSAPVWVWALIYPAWVKILYSRLLET